MADYREVTACRLCDSTDLTEALNLGETPLANELGAMAGCPKCHGPCHPRQWEQFKDPAMLEVMCFPCGVRYSMPPAKYWPPCEAAPAQELFPLVVMRCGKCGHHQLSIAVSPARLWGPDYPYQSGTSPVFRAHLEKLADEVAALKPGGRVLEIGSNDGTLVFMLRDRGLHALGLDPSGPDDDEGGLTRMSWPPPGEVPLATHDVILALNVFAHVDDLHSFTAAVKEALAPDGVFIVEVGYLPDVIAGGLFDVVYHEHLSMHHLQPLYEFFFRHDLAIVEAKRIDSQGGSVRIYVQHRGGYKLQQPKPFPDWKEEANITNLRPVIDVRSVSLRSALNKLFERQEMVCIYGAPAKLTTLLYATGLDKMPFNCVGDDNPRKVGRTTPGNHIPIVSVEEMLARKPDTILVASWNFFDDIRDKLRAAGFKGGIINPMSND